MEKNNRNVLLMEKLTELNELEITKMKILTAIFIKTLQEIKNKKVQSMESNFEEQAKVYGQDLADYQEVYYEIMNKYKDQIEQIIERYNELFINIQLELQEAECNQKIAITNFKKSFDIKLEAMSISKENLAQDYSKKMLACMQKKENYDVIIKACQKELEDCVEEAENKLNSLFINKAGQLVLREESFFTKLMDKIKNMFTGRTKFNTYCIESTNVELEMIERKLPDHIKQIRQKTIHFVAKIKQAKDETNLIFEKMK